MATLTVRTDDLDGSGDATPVTFSINDLVYSIDLSPKNFDKLTKALSPFVAKATKDRTGTRRAARQRRDARVTDESFDPVVVRAWARKQGMELADRGRIPAAIVAKWRAEQGR
jgi:hypothetical protein